MYFCDPNYSPKSDNDEIHLFLLPLLREDFPFDVATGRVPVRQQPKKKLEQPKDSSRLSSQRVWSLPARTMPDEIDLRVRRGCFFPRNFLDLFFCRLCPDRFLMTGDLTEGWTLERVTGGAVATAAGRKGLRKGLGMSLLKIMSQKWFERFFPML